jgi:hypothetical protein
MIAVGQIGCQEPVPNQHFPIRITSELRYSIGPFRSELRRTLSSRDMKSFVEKPGRIVFPSESSSSSSV